MSGSAWFQQIEKEVEDAVKAIRWPARSRDFAIRPVKKGNGVDAIKEAFVLKLVRKYRWTDELRYKIPGQLSKGPVDAARMVTAMNRYFAVEWETGNISSSHRALNKMAIGIMDDQLCGGILVVPSRKRTP